MKKTLKHRNIINTSVRNSSRSFSPSAIRSSLFFVCLCLFSFSYGQKPYLRSIKVNDEIQQSSITCLYLDNNNFMWIGTSKGLYQFDGTDFTLCPSREKEGAINVSAIYMAPDKALWVGTRTGEIYRLHDDSLQLFNPEEGNPKVAITGFTSDKSGNLWFASYGEGVYYYDGKHIYNINSDDGLTDNYCYTIIPDDAGRLWISTDGGISVLSIQNGKRAIKKITTIEGLPDNIVLSLTPDGTGIWAGMQDAGICRIDKKTFKISIPAASASWTFGPVSRIVTGSGWLWVSTERNGILSIETTSGKINGNYINIDNQNLSRINELYGDKQGNYWIASGSQLYISLGNDLLLYKEAEKVTGRNIHSVLADCKGNIWFSNDDGLFRIDNQSGVTSRINLTLKKSTHFISLYEDKNGYIWAGTFGSGFFCIRPDGKKSKLFSELDGLSNGNILAITGKDNQMWLATLGGAYKCDISGDPLANGSHVNFTNYGDQHFPGNNYIYSVFIDSRNRVWFGTDGKGISMLENGRFVNFDKAQGLKNNIIYSITEDSDGDIWFSTSNAGIYRYDGKKLRNYSEKDGLSDLHITGLLADKRNHLMIIHNNGVDVLDTRRHEFLYYSSSIGISDINPDLNVCDIDAHEVAWLGTQNGLIRIQIPDDISRRQPALQLNMISVFLGKENFYGTHVFPYNKNHISFHFNALWYIAPNLVKYQIRLKSYDLDWIETRNNLVTYSNLPPGDYTFEVRSSIKGYFSKSEIRSYTITIEKPFWKTNIFIIAVILLFGLLVYLIVTLREKEMKKRDAMEREKIMFQFQTLRSQVNPHFLFNSFSTLISIIDEDKDVAIEYVEKLSQFFRDLLDYRDKDLIELSEEMKLMGTYFYLQKKRYCENLMLDINISEQARTSLIPPMVLQMLVENTIKHNVVSADRPLSVRIFTDDKYISVSNNLQRKKDKEPSTGIGITNISNRYALLGFGEIEIISSENSFTVKLPLIYPGK